MIALGLCIAVALLGISTVALSFELRRTGILCDDQGDELDVLRADLADEQARVIRHKDTVAELAQETTCRGNRIAALTVELTRTETDNAELRADKALLGELLIRARAQDNVIALPDPDSVSRHPAGRDL